MMESFADVIARWPSIDDLAADLDQKPDTVRKWKQRRNIPADYWLDLIRSARKRRISLDERTLVRIAASTASNGSSSPRINK
jgi:uncharacterized protein YjcR